MGPHLLGLRVRIPPEARIYVSCECCACKLEVSASDQSLVQRNPIDCAVSEYDREKSIMRLWCTRGFGAMGKGGGI